MDWEIIRQIFNIVFFVVFLLMIFNFYNNYKNTKYNTSENNDEVDDALFHMNQTMKDMMELVSDITDAKDYANKQIEENEKKYKIILSTIPDYIYIIDEFGYYKEIVPSSNTKYKDDINNLIGKNILNIFSDKPEMIEQIKNLIKESKDKDETQWFEYKLNDRYFVSSITGINHKKERFVWVARDITELKNKDKNIRDFKEYLTNILNSIPDPVAVKDDEFRILFANTAYCNFTGRKIEDILYKKYDQFPINNEKTNYLVNNGDLKALNNGYYCGEEDVNYKDNNTFKKCIVKKTLTKGDNNKKYIVVTFHDIQELKDKEKELEQSKYFLEKIINSIREPIYVKDINNRYILVNDSFCKFFKKNRNQILGFTLREISKDINAIEEIYNDDKNLLECLNTDKSICRSDQILNYCRDSKNCKFYQLRKDCFIDKHLNKFIIGVIRDVDDIKTSQEEMERLVKEKTKELETLKDYYYHLFNDVPVGIFKIKIKDGKFIEANDYCIQALGCKTFEELHSRSAIELYDNPLTRDKIINQVGSDESKRSVFILKVKSFDKERTNKYFLISEIIQNFDDLEKAHFDGVFIDITKQKQLEEELDNTKKLYEALEKRISKSDVNE